jgi:hypothetical protein
MWQGKIPSAAKSRTANEVFYSAAEAAPLQNNNFFSSLLSD